MKEIKFRAWNKRDDCWIGGFCIHSSGLFSEIVEPQHMAVADANWKDPESLDDVIIMRFTGFYDKNDKEIYEGDIIEFFHPGLGKVKEKVCFENGKFGLYKPICDIGDCWFLTEVIGNIYENHELLL